MGIACDCDSGDLQEDYDLNPFGNRFYFDQALCAVLRIKFESTNNIQLLNLHPDAQL